MDLPWLRAVAQIRHAKIAGWPSKKQLGFDFIASEGNVSDWDSTKAAFDKVKAEVGEISVLVNNAGITKDGCSER
jgi:NAD(P)-dependent dehydrogenase (short-subunit alcohol dehydrogenase family)